MERRLISAQQGFQVNFLESAADLVIGGGAAGAGKTYALLMEPIRHSANPHFRAVIFRRTIPQIKNEGGLWDTSKELYLKLRDNDGRQPTATDHPPKWKFPSGATLLFAGLESESSKFSWDGSQVALLCFDELIHFSQSQFWYLVGRNRSTSGIRPYVRATTNPQTSGWVKRLISWWIYPDDYADVNLRGMAIPERSGVLRYYFRYSENMYWADSAKELLKILPADVADFCRLDLIKSATFVPGTLDDNKKLTACDPSYESNLFSQDRNHAERLRRGCWYDHSGENELFSFTDVLDLFTNTFVASSPDWFMTADVAMEGSDKFVVGIWCGLRLENIYVFDKSDGKFIFDEITKLANKYCISGKHIVFDANGVGNFLKGFFRSSYDFRSQNVPLLDQGMKVSFQNLRVQCLFKLSELVSSGKIYLNVSSDSQRNIISEELDAHKKTGQNARGALTVSSKDSVKSLIRRSPDYVDMLLMRMVFEIRSLRKSGLVVR